MTTILSNFKHQALVPIQFPLASKFYRQHNNKSKVSGSDIVWVTRYNNDIVAASRLSLVLPNYRLLTNVFVASDYRKQGIAQQLLQHLCDESLLTYTFSLQHLQKLYQQVGFQVVRPDELPCELAQMFVAYVKQGRNIVAMIRHVK